MAKAKKYDPSKRLTAGTYKVKPLSYFKELGITVDSACYQFNTLPFCGGMFALCGHDVKVNSKGQDENFYEWFAWMVEGKENVEKLSEPVSHDQKHIDQFLNAIKEVTMRYFVGRKVKITENTEVFIGTVTGADFGDFSDYDDSNDLALTVKHQQSGKEETFILDTEYAVCLDRLEFLEDK